jgi:hypothetical protein
MLEEYDMPSRLQKRWSGRLRTAGALLTLLGLVGLADRLVGLASPSPGLSPIGRQVVPLWAGIALLGLGVSLFVWGKRWS